MSPTAITDEGRLEAVVGSRPATHHLKSITDLDEHCRTILAASPFAVLGMVAGDGSLRSVAIGGEPGVIGADSDHRLGLPPTPGLDVPDGAPAGLLALVPGYGETLRVNGRLGTGTAPGVEVEEAFLHCAKAMIRSHLWDETDLGAGARSATASSLDDPDAVGFLAHSPFVVLSSVDADGFADVSPKGDPAGFVQLLDEATIAIPDRPGNRRTDTLHNLMTRPDLAVLALVPGDHRVMEIRGTAHVTDDEAIRAPMETNGKVPKAAIVLDVTHVDLRHEPALAAARLWDTSQHVEPGTLPKATKVWVDHVKRNDDPGLAARAARRVVSERAMAPAIARDYRSNLY